MSMPLTDSLASMRFLNAFGIIGRFFVLGAIASAALSLALGGDARAALLIVALSVGTTGLVFAWVGRKLGRVSSLDRQLRAIGVPGSATITSLRETGVAVNGSPVIEFGLKVDVTAHAPYSVAIKQRAPRLLMGSFPPGSVVAIVADPADAQHLAIDWEQGVDPVQRSPLAADEPVAIGEMRDSQELLETGRRATAMIVSMEDAGDMSELGLVEIGAPGDDDRLMVIGLDVKQPGLDSYEVRVAHRVPEHLLGRVGPRTRVDVAVDRGDEQAVAIDWNSIAR